MFPLPLVVTVRRSARLGVALIGLHLLAMAALWLALLPIALQAVGTLALLLGLWRSRRPRPPLTLRCHGDGKLEMKSGDAWSLLGVERSAVLLPWLTVLRFAQADGKGSDFLLVTPDATDWDDFRRLRVWLRWTGTKAPL
jgi:hypothetical protein